jgi:hypothetical protein
MAEPGLSLADVTPGERLQADGGFDCIGAGALVPIHKADDGALYFICAHGRHHLDGQADDGGRLVGLSRPADADAVCCIACAIPFKVGDKYLADYGGGFLHAACCGPERESYVDLETGEPIAEGEPLPTPQIWVDD